MDGWKTILSFWGPAYFQGELLVSGRVFFLSLKKCCLEYNWTCSKSDSVISFLPQDLFKSPGILRAWKDPSPIFLKFGVFDLSWDKTTTLQTPSFPPRPPRHWWKPCRLEVFWDRWRPRFALKSLQLWMMSRWAFFGSLLSRAEIWKRVLSTRWLKIFWCVCGCHSWFQGISYSIISHHVLTYHITQLEVVFWWFLHTKTEFLDIYFKTLNPMILIRPSSL